MLVIASEDDFATHANRVREWFDRLRAPRKLVDRRFDNHFFRGHERWLADTIAAFLAQEVTLHDSDQTHLPTP
jgi:hypothetical protein